MSVMMRRPKHPGHRRQDVQQEIEGAAAAGSYNLSANGGLELTLEVINDGQKERLGHYPYLRDFYHYLSLGTYLCTYIPSSGASGA